MLGTGEVDGLTSTLSEAGVASTLRNRFEVARQAGGLPNSYGETLTGGGADTAGHGHTTFDIIKGQSTNVTIKDFTVGDKVEFDGYTSLEVSQAHLQSTAAGTTLTLTDNTKITFVGMDLKTIK